MELPAGGVAVGTAAPLHREEPLGEIKMPTQRSIQTGLLENTAAFVEGDVAAARISGSVTISALTRSVSGEHSDHLIHRHRGRGGYRYADGAAGQRRSGVDGLCRLCAHLRFGHLPTHHHH